MPVKELGGYHSIWAGGRAGLITEFHCSCKLSLCIIWAMYVMLSPTIYPSLWHTLLLFHMKCPHCNVIPHIQCPAQLIGVSGSGSPSLQLLWFCFSGAALKLHFRCRLSQAHWFIPAIPTLPTQGWDERVATNLSYIVSSRSVKSVDRDPVLKIKPNKARKKKSSQPR